MSSKGYFFDLLNRHCEEVNLERFSEAGKGQNYIEFNGSMVPFSYGELREEYEQVRNNFALFDMSATRKIRVKGRDAGNFLDRILSRTVNSGPGMRVVYALICAETGCVADDVIIYKLSSEEYIVMPALMDGAYLDYLRASICNDLAVTIEEESGLAGVALQGPASAEVLRRCGFDDIADLRPFSIREYGLAGSRMLIARMGFTGDLGYECWVDRSCCGALGEVVSTAGATMGLRVSGYGLAVAEACRIEAGLIVPGRDLATDRVPNPGFERFPAELGLDWLVKLDGREFLGREALAAHVIAGPRFVLRSLTIAGDHRLPHGTELLADEEVIGHVTSSSWSWGLCTTIGHASIAVRHAERAEAAVVVAGQRAPVALHKGPLIRLLRKTQVPAPSFG
ncbi:MAG TPA: aminomethyltransferase family protein [Novosphingobium sp.]